MTDIQRVTWTAFAILAMFSPTHTGHSKSLDLDDCVFFAILAGTQNDLANYASTQFSLLWSSA